MSRREDVTRREGRPGRVAPGALARPASTSAAVAELDPVADIEVSSAINRAIALSSPINRTVALTGTINRAVSVDGHLTRQ